MVTYEAVNRYGAVVRTFSDHELALNYQSDMRHQGSEFLIRQARRRVSYSGMEVHAIARQAA